jgi:branched-chain amino acid transport system substrate-binding protein
MYTKYKKFAAMAAVVGLALAGCGSPSGGSDGSSSDASSEAKSVAKALGIDLDNCPSDVTKKFGSTVKVGNTMPLTGPVAPAFGTIGPALKAAFKVNNADSGLSTKFELTTLDDAFTPDKALTSTQTLLDKDKVDLMTTVIATEQVAAVREVLGEECVPLISGISGGASANDPSKFPWTTVFSQPFAVDARIMMADITDKFPAGAKVAILAANSASGKDYLAALKKYAGKNTIVKTESVEATDTASPSSQITTLRATGADAFIAVPNGPQCAPTMQETANQGWDVESYITSTCNSATFDAAGEAADGWHITTFVKDATRGKYATDPDVLAAVDAIKKESPKTPITNTTTGGLLYVEPFFKAAKDAAMSPLGLSRLGMMEAVTHLDFQPKLLMPGIKFKLDGVKDQVAIEASYLSQYQASTKTFTDGKLYDFEGQMTE